MFTPQCVAVALLKSFTNDHVTQVIKPVKGKTTVEEFFNLSFLNYSYYN
jgi:hypothetical protein